MDDPRARRAAAVLDRCEEEPRSPAIALMELLIATEDLGLVAEIVGARAKASEGAADIARLIDAHPGGCERVAAMLRSGVDVPPENGSVEEGVAFCRRLFDWSVHQSEEASVALYSLGSPEILRAATREIVLLLEGWGSFGAETSALDIGCGIGRLEEALAPRVREIQAIDVSEEMIASARRRCAAWPNAVFSPCSGLDLGRFEDSRFDLVFAVDSFPYLVQSGMSLVRTHFAEAARVLRAGGELVILNLSYRDDLARDRLDVASLARESGFDALVLGTQPFTLWNGSAFRLRAAR